MTSWLESNEDIAETPDGLKVIEAGVIWAMTMKRRRAAEQAGARFAYLFMRPDGAELPEIAAWIDAGKLKPIVHATYPLAEFREAFADLERGRARGKIVVTI